MRLQVVVVGVKKAWRCPKKMSLPAVRRLNHASEPTCHVIHGASSTTRPPFLSTVVAKVEKLVYGRFVQAPVGKFHESHYAPHIIPYHT